MLKNDTAKFAFSDGSTLTGELVLVPTAETDSWVIHQAHDTIVYVRNFETATILNRKAEEEAQ